jgi:predicted dehydrogenase
MKALLADVQGPKSMILTINAGQIPADHWTQDPAIGGGRIVGEACHFIDLARFLAGAPVAAWAVQPTGLSNARGTADTATLGLTFEDGSTASIHYFANGHRGMPKERIDVFAGGKVLQLDNFVSLRAHGFSAMSYRRMLRQDKGQAACAAAFVRAMKGDASGLIPRAELFEVSRIAIAAEAAIRA